MPVKLLFPENRGKINRTHMKRQNMNRSADVARYHTSEHCLLLVHYTSKCLKYLPNKITIYSYVLTYYVIFHI